MNISAFIIMEDERSLEKLNGLSPV